MRYQEGVLDHRLALRPGDQTVETFEGVTRERGRQIEAAGLPELRVGLEGARNRCPEPASGN